MNRRDVLAATGTALTGALAGCASTASATVRPPRPSKTKLQNGGWAKIRENTETLYKKDFQIATVEATASTRVWEDAALRKTLTEKTMGRMDTKVSVFFASRIAIEPTLSSLPKQVKDPLKEEIEKKASKKFEEQISGMVKEVSAKDVDKTVTVDTGEEATLTKYTAKVAVPDFTYQSSGGQGITIKGGTFTIDGYLATWIHNGAVYVAGGVYPGENYTRSIKRNLTSAISAEINIDLGLTPEDYRKELFGLIKSTS